MTSQRFRRLTDLFVDGTAIPVGDGTYLWLQTLNAFERDEAISDAQIARARFVMALRENGDERIRIETRRQSVGREAFIEDLAAAKADGQYATVMGRLEDDPDWSEKVAILRRTDFANNASSTPEEQEVVSDLLNEWSEEVSRRLRDELDYQRQRYADASDEELLADYIEAYMERRGDDIANAEYALTEAWYSTRYCNATGEEGDKLDHFECDGHVQRVFAAKADVKAAPDRLRTLIREGLQTLAMSLRDPKDSGSPQSSSDSSPRPSEAEA